MVIPFILLYSLKQGKKFAKEGVSNLLMTSHKKQCLHRWQCAAINYVITIAMISCEDELQNMCDYIHIPI